MFRNNSIQAKKEFMYLPKHTNVPTQDSPQCYYFSFLHLLSMHGNQNNVPPYVEEIVNTCKDKATGYREVIIGKITEHAESLTWVADEIIDNEDSEYDGDWAEDFVDKYGVDFALARLLNLSVKEFNDANINVDSLTTGQLKNILEIHGPIAIRLKRGNILSDEKISASETVKTSNGLIKNIYDVDNHADIPHCVLLIGSKEYPTQKVYFIDPNHPQMILSMNFNFFKENILIPEFVYLNGSNLEQDEVIFESVKHKKRKNSNDNHKTHKKTKALRQENGQEARKEVSQAEPFSYRDNVISIWKAESGSIVPVISDNDSLMFPELSKFFGSKNNT